MGQKTEGNMDDVHRVIANLKDGMVWDRACREGEFMPVDKSWYEKNKALLYEWLEHGVPPPPGLADASVKPAPVNTVSTPDGKVWAIYRDAKGGFYREEVTIGAPAPVPDQQTVAAPSEKLMSPAPEMSPVPSKNKQKQW